MKKLGYILTLLIFITSPAKAGDFDSSDLPFGGNSILPMMGLGLAAAAAAGAVYYFWYSDKIEVPSHGIDDNKGLSRADCPSVTDVRQVKPRENVRKSVDHTEYLPSKVINDTNCIPSVSKCPEDIPNQELKFIEGNKRRPIYLAEKIITGHYIEEYNRTHKKQIKPENLSSVEGSLTYYGAHPLLEEKIGKPEDMDELHDDFGWGCAWRASINLLNNVKVWLETRDIFPHQEKNGRQINMYDLKEWMPNWSKRLWIEPADNAELFWRFIKNWYSKENQAKINSLLEFKGYLFLKEGDTKEGFIASIIDNQVNRSKLEELTAYYNKTKELKAAYDKKLVQETLDKQLTPTKLKELKASYDKKLVQETLGCLYESDYANNNISVENFPKFDKQTHPFPVNIDDKTFGRNIYGFNACGDIISHVFIGETHVWEGESPWDRCHWAPVKEIFSKSIMMFAINVKQ